MSIPYFMVAKKPTVIMGCLMVLEIWNSLFNQSECLLQDHELEELVKSIIFHLRDI